MVAGEDERELDGVTRSMSEPDPDEQELVLSLTSICIGELSRPISSSLIFEYLGVGGYMESGLGKPGTARPVPRFSLSPILLAESSSSDF